MGREVQRVPRRGRKVRITAGALSALGFIWTGITQTVSAINLPADAGDAWKALVSAPEYLPIGLTVLCVLILVWSLWPANPPDAEAEEDDDEDGLPPGEAEPEFPEPHKSIVMGLAEPLSRLEHIALDRSGADFEAFSAAKATAQRLIGQIPYDPSTVQTVRDFIQACSIALDAGQHNEDDREARSDVARISPALFRFLHEGRSVERDKVDLPDWCRSAAEQTFEEAWDEASSGWIPFIRLREFAPVWGIPLSRIGPGQNNAYHLEGALRQAAVRGQLRVEGRQYRGPVRHNDPLVPIPPDHFRDYGFGHGVLNYDEANDASHTGDVRMMTLGQRGKEDVTFYDLHLRLDDARAVVTNFATDPRIERP